MTTWQGDGPLSAVHLEPQFRPLNIIGLVGGNNPVAVFACALRAAGLTESILKGLESC